MRVSVRHQCVPKMENGKKYDQARATELEMLYQLRTMSKRHKQEVKELRAKLADAEKTVLQLKEEVYAMRMRAKR